MARHTELLTVFVLRRVLFKEADLMLTLLSEQRGVIQARARGARASQKRFAGGLSLFRKLSAVVEIDDRFDVATLKEVSLLTDFSRLEGSYERIAFSSYATELLRAIVQDHVGEEVPFKLLEEFYHDFGGIEDHVYVMELRLDRFMFELLSWWGRAPALFNCARCGLEAHRMQKYRFLRSGEGLVCGECRRQSDSIGVVCEQAYYILSFIAGKEESMPSKLAELQALQQVRRVLQASMGQVVTWELKSYSILKPLLP